MAHTPARIANALRHAGFLLALAFASHTAHATFITFDERPWVLGPDEYAWYSNPITTEYDGLGVQFTSAYLQQPFPPYGASQFILGGPDFSIRFTGTLPTYVNFSFTSPIPEFRATVGATGSANESLGSFDTGGDYWAGPDLGWVHTHYNAHSFASFSSPNGISSLWFGTEASTRIIGKIDNLYFGFVPAVPEPGSLALMAAGLGLLAAVKHRRRYKS